MHFRLLISAVLLCNLSFSQNIKEWQSLKVLSSFENDSINTSFNSFDALFLLTNDSIEYNTKHWTRFLMNVNPLQYKDDNFKLTFVMPINYSFGKGQGKSNYRTMFGGLILGSYKSKIKFYTGFTEDRIKLLNPGEYETTRLFPGHSLLRTEGKNVFNFSDSYSRLIYSSNEFFKLTVAYDKEFIGEGLNSLFLSDYSNYHPFLKLDLKNKIISYQSQFHILSNVGTSSSFNYRKKGGVFRKLGVRFKNITTGLFSGIIWAIDDSLGRSNYRPEYVLPILFLRPIEYSLGSVDNSIMGLWFNYKYRNTKWYSQFVIDDLNVKESFNNPSYFQNKIGYQLGVKTLIEKDNHLFYLLLEHNLVRPYTYAHKKPELNYSNYGFELAHPLGANFWDINGILTWEHNRFGVNLFLSYYEKGIDDANDSFGGDIFQSDYNSINGLFSLNNPILQGSLKSNFGYSFSMNYLIHPSNNLKLQCGIQKNEESYLFLKLKSNFNFNYKSWLN